MAWSEVGQFSGNTAFDLKLKKLPETLSCTFGWWTAARLSVFQLTVLTLAAALPSASNVSLQTERYSADSGRVARIILASMVLAFGSFTALVW